MAFEFRGDYSWIVIVLFFVLMFVPIISGFFVNWKKATYWGVGTLSFYCLGWILAGIAGTSIAYNVINNFHIEIPNVDKDSLALIISNYVGIGLMVICLLIGFVFLTIFYFSYAKKHILKINNEEKIEVKEQTWKRKLMLGVLSSVISFSTTLPITNSIDELAYASLTTRDQRTNSPGMLSDLYQYVNGFNNVFGYNYTNKTSETTDAIIATVDLVNIRDSNGEFIFTRIFNEIKDMLRNYLIDKGDDYVDFSVKRVEKLSALKGKLERYSSDLYDREARVKTAMENAFSAIEELPNLENMVANTILSNMSDLSSEITDQKFLETQSVLDAIIYDQTIAAYDDKSATKETNGVNFSFENIGAKTSVKMGNNLYRKLIEGITPKIFGKQTDFETNKAKYLTYVGKLFSVFFHPSNEVEFSQSQGSFDMKLIDGSVAGLFNKKYILDKAKTSNKDWISENTFNTFKDISQDGTENNPYLIPLNALWSKNEQNQVVAKNVFPENNTMKFNASFESYPNLYPSLNATFESSIQIASGDSQTANKFINFQNTTTGLSYPTFSISNGSGGLVDSDLTTFNLSHLLKLKVSLSYKPNLQNLISKDFYLGFFWVSSNE